MIPINTFSDSYDEALKYEAKGDYSNFHNLIFQYFDKNINDINQDEIIYKLNYSATLFPTIDESLNLLLKYVKYNKYRNTRSVLYKKIAEIYELSGQIYNAGTYYEKAAYTIKDEIDYNSLLNSIDMLLELGYFDVAIKKLNEIKYSKIDKDLKDKYFSLLSRCYFYKGNLKQAEVYLLKIQNKDSYYFYLLNIFEINENDTLNKSSLESYILKNPYSRLKNPNEYIGVNSQINRDSKASSNIIIEEELTIGVFQQKKDASGIINILEQMNLTWYFDLIETKYKLLVFTTNKIKTSNELKKLGLIIKD
ncbi:MAG: hypothetical protein OCD02_09690 [Spirochaetaceae bacterium]